MRNLRVLEKSLKSRSIYLGYLFSVQVDRRVYEKFWTKWRHQLIRKRVSEMMMKHEEKKQLSEVTPLVLFIFSILTKLHRAFLWFWRQTRVPCPLLGAGLVYIFRQNQRPNWNVLKLSIFCYEREKISISPFAFHAKQSK